MRVTDRHHRRGFSVVPGSLLPGKPRPDLAAEVQQVREDAVARYTEVDLLVAALREHVADLRLERDRLLGENQRLNAELQAVREREAAAGARWLISRQKTQR